MRGPAAGAVQQVPKPATKAMRAKPLVSNPQAAAAAPPSVVAAAPAATTPAPAASSPGVAGPGDEVAPLGGVVQTVHVSVGQAINEGDKLVSLEAMKMVTHVVARRGGKVVSIAVKPGDPVDAGQVLLTIG